MNLSAAELEFLRSQRFGRLATVSPAGWPHVMPVMYAVDAEGRIEFDADGVKLRNLTAEPRVAFVVDATGPKRGVSLQGLASVIGPQRARLVPERAFTWGLSEG